VDSTPPRRPRSYITRSQSDRLKDVESALNALATDPDIGAAMTPAGYGATGIAEGRALYDTVRAAGKTQGTARNRRLNLTASQDGAVGAAETLYGPLAERARVIFKKRPDDLTALGLTGEHGGSLAERLDRMRDFARTAREPGRNEAFTKVGVDSKAFDALDAALAAASTQVTTQDLGAGVAQDTSGSKRAAFTLLDDWMTTMHGHARIDLATRPDLQEPLGVHPR
jgi:hypothetical protein